MTIGRECARFWKGSQQGLCLLLARPWNVGLVPILCASRSLGDVCTAALHVHDPVMFSVKLKLISTDTSSTNSSSSKTSKGKEMLLKCRHYSQARAVS